ncbi:DUF4785 domain-containing protein [Pseudoalteromonas fenneropenaei]|uniref:DUF4785 domain-containing protein n=1 Tax=Pseudoalteromonas fenneropenaei TaxID=1737459 RepID=A0ABV7CNG6_9GAMM
MNKKIISTLLPVVLALTTGQTQAIENYVSYQYPSAHAAITEAPSQSLSSSEYWQVVSGKELRLGVEMAFSSSKSVVLLSPRAELKNGQLYRAPAVKEGAIRLYTHGQEQKLTTSYDRDEMAGYGFAPGSAAVQANQLKGKQATLRLTQLIEDSDSYLLHVKESDSPYQLTVNANNVMAAQGRLPIQAEFAGKKLAVSELQAMMRAPNGDAVAVSTQSDGIHLDAPLTYIGARQGLYNLELHSTQSVDGLQVKRSIRVPFVNQQQTANVVKHTLEVTSPSRVSAKVKLEVKEEGRYGVTATLFGLYQGKFAALATTEAAQDFTQSDTLPLEFVLPKGATGPFKLSILELKDQTRLQRFVVNAK